jgi:hypothetical protein
MDVERKTVVQVVVTVTAVLIFIAALVGLSSAFGVTQTAEDEPLNGSFSGEFEELEVENGEVTGTFSGEYSDSIVATVEGSVDGTVSDRTLTAEFDGTISGAIDGTLTGEMNGTLDREEETFDGTFDGTTTGETQTTLSPDGGLVLIGLMALFIVLMPIVGYFIERGDFDDEDGDE